MLVIFIICRPQVRRNSVDIYLLGLGLSDFGRLVTSLVYDISYLNKLPWPGATCPSMLWLRIWLGCTSSWIIVVFTVERLFVTYYPMKKPSCTRRKAMVITATVFLIFFLMNLYIFKYQDNSMNIMRCMGKNPHFKKALLAFEMAAYSIFPGTLISMTNFSICAVLYNRHNVSILEYARRNFRSADSHKMFSLLVINGVTFIVLTLPDTLLNLYRRSRPESIIADHSLENNLAALFFLMTNLNHGINPLIYTLVGARYREVLLNMLYCKWKRVAHGTIAGASGFRSGGRSISSKHACSLTGHRKLGTPGALGFIGTSEQCSRSGALASISEDIRSFDDDFRSTSDIRRKSPFARRKASLVGPAVSLILAGGSDDEGESSDEDIQPTMKISTLPYLRPPPIPPRSVPIYSKSSLPKVHQINQPIQQSSFHMLL